MLNKITINNFKSLKHLEYDCAGLNLLTGMNGAGKSSFIQMLRIMRQIASKAGETRFELAVDSISPELSAGDFRCCYANNFEMSFAVDFRLHNSSSQVYSYKRIVLDGVETELGNSVVVEHPDYERLYQDCYGEYEDLRRKAFESDEDGRLRSDVTDDQLGEALSKADFAFRREMEKMRTTDAEAASAYSSLWKGFRFVDAFRQKPTAVHVGGRYSQISAMFDGLADKAFNAEGQDVAEYIYKSQGFHEERNDLLDRINACLAWVSPGAKLSVAEQDVGGKEHFIESVSYGDNAAAHQFKPQNVGFGISYILPVLVTLLSAKTGSIIIIENPEAHLHPRGQAEMGKLIAETVARGVQVFVETHSDHVINGIRVAVKKGVVKPSDVNIAFFERGPHDMAQEDGTINHEIYAEVTNIKVDATGSLSEWPKDFMDEWGIQQMKLLRP